MSRSLQILSETKIDIDGIRRSLGTDNKPAHKSTVFRSMDPGILLDDGTRATLEFLKIGGRLFSSVEAIERFVARINGIDLDTVEVASTSTLSKRRIAELARVDAELTAAGI